MSGWSKLFSSILDSTVWDTDPATTKVWFCLMAMADRDGVVEASVPGLANRAKVDRAACEKALALFLAPDVDSRTRDHEGRRIEEVDGGWKLLNYEKYRDKASADEARQKNAERQKRWRERNALRNAKSRPSRKVTHSDADADADADADKIPETETAARGRRLRPEPADPLVEKHRTPCQSLWSKQDAMRLAAIPGARSMAPTTRSLRLVADRLEEGYRVEDCEHVLSIYAHDAKADPGQARWFNGETNWRPDNFRRALGRPVPAPPKQYNGRG